MTKALGPEYLDNLQPESLDQNTRINSRAIPIVV